MTVDEVLSSHAGPPPGMAPGSDAMDPRWLDLATRAAPPLSAEQRTTELEDPGPATADWRPPSLVPALTPAEEADFAEYEYKSRLPIAITGIIQRGTRNRVTVGKVAVLLPDALFALFLRLVVALHDRKEGTVHDHDLQQEGVLPETNPSMSINRLRKKFEPALQGLPTNDLIERWRQKTVRLSTHPRLIQYDRTKLLRHDLPMIRSLAERLPPPAPRPD